MSTYPGIFFHVLSAGGNFYTHHDILGTSHYVLHKKNSMRNGVDKKSGDNFNLPQFYTK
jgi:hypothetical protein